MRRTTDSTITLSPGEQSPGLGLRQNTTTDPSQEVFA